MMLLNAINYDPATLTTKATTSGLPMTAFDTTNLRLSFTAPPTGRVLVRLRVCISGSSTVPGVFLGVLDGATVVMRTVPLITGYVGAAQTLYGVEATFTITGLTSGQTYTWDAAYGVEHPVSSTSFRYGGPNDTVASNAAGAIHFEVWEA
jgi:hypothetical protein